MNRKARFLTSGKFIARLLALFYKSLNMKLQFFLLLPLLLVFSVAAPAQVVSKDSLAALKSQKAYIKLAQTINEQKIKLAGMENSVAEKNRSLQKAEARASELAAQNASLAADLNKDNTNKRLARKSHKSARSARKAAKAARIAASRLESLESAILSLKEKISKNEAKLGAMPVSPS